MTTNDQIVLASASPRRKRLLSEMGLEFSVVPADIDEAMMPGEIPVEYAVRAAGEKGLTVASRLAKEGCFPWVISADTVVLLGDEVLTKPTDDDHAIEILSKLAGRTHCVVTGWAVGKHGGEWTAEHCETRVTFHSLTRREIERYVATGEGRDKAGSYAIQEIGSFLVDRIEGDYFNVVGLPISRVVRALAKRGVSPEFLQ